MSKLLSKKHLILSNQIKDTFLNKSLKSMIESNENKLNDNNLYILKHSVNGCYHGKSNCRYCSDKCKNFKHKKKQKLKKMCADT